MSRPLRTRAAIVASVLLLIGAAIAVLHFRADGSTVGIRLAGTELRLMFPRDCAVRVVRLDDQWEIRADRSHPLPKEVLVGTPPPGFQEWEDSLAPPLPAAIIITARNALWYGGHITLSELQDGSRHDVTLRPIMNELSPATGLC